VNDKILADAIHKFADRKIESKRFNLLVSDIEGCINLNEYEYDYAGIGILRDLCRLAGPSNALPEFTLCSGRQYPFVEAIASILSVDRPCIFENGAAMYRPGMPLYSRIESAAAVTDFDWGGIGRMALGRLLTEGQRGVIEIGKEYILTLHPGKGVTVAALLCHSLECISNLGLDLSVGNSASAVDICPPGVDKGTAISWLARVCEIPIESIATIGDSQGDVPMLRRGGISGAPANAADSVLSLVEYPAKSSDVRGVIDFALHVAEINDKAGA
jgi:HAD superfamily hydrolase (TIGR01484 family)